MSFHNKHILTRDRRRGSAPYCPNMTPCLMDHLATTRGRRYTLLDLDKSVPPKHYKSFPVPKKVHMDTFKKELDHLDWSIISCWNERMGITYIHYITPIKDGRVRWLTNLTLSQHGSETTAVSHTNYSRCSHTP